MRIGLNLLYLLPGVVGGTQTYATSLIRALVERDSGDEFRVYVNRESSDLALPDHPAVTVVTCPVHASSRPRRYAYEQLRFPDLIAREDLDVLHSLGYVGPLRVSVPHVVTIHDLIYVGFRDHMSARRRAALRLFVRGTARRSDRVITMSDNARREILDDMGLAPERVVTIHEAGRDVPAGDLVPPAVLATYGIDSPYVVAFSSHSPSKNIPALVEAFARIAPDVDESLVLIGHIPADSGLDQQVARLGIADRVVTTGYVPDDHVLPLIAGARLFAFPSLYEGFGLPVLDAQAVGVPVVCSGVASLPEVAGEGALLFDPTSTSDIADALRHGLTDDAVRDRLVAAGSANLARFSWDDAARRTLDVYREVAR
ncbi:MAG: glycosyltransferase family 4 protein [Acidimicrobiales bacterium]